MSAPPSNRKEEMTNEHNDLFVDVRPATTVLLRGGTSSSNYHHPTTIVQSPTQNEEEEEEEEEKVQLVEQDENEQQRNDERKCWIQQAIQSRKLVVFSHRSFSNFSFSCNTSTKNQTKQQIKELLVVQQGLLGVAPSVAASVSSSCKEALIQLKSIGVNHFDIDLVLHDPPTSAEELTRERILLVAHPMEYKMASDCYSPCSNQKFDDFVTLLKQVYNGHDFFLSMEPKAAWKRTVQELQDPALTNLPSDILQSMLDAIEKHDLKRHQCAAIVNLEPLPLLMVQDDISKMQTKTATALQEQDELKKQHVLLQNILQHCQHFIGIRITDGSLLEQDIVGSDTAMLQKTGRYYYDKYMPTLEFHPNHPRNPHRLQQQQQQKQQQKQQQNLWDTLTFPPMIPWNKSIVWLVDNEQDLLMAADVKPFGIVSNDPMTIHNIIQSPSWCPKKLG